MWTAAHLQKTSKNSYRKSRKKHLFFLKPNDFPWGTKLIIIGQKLYWPRENSRIREKNTYDRRKKLNEADLKFNLLDEKGFLTVTPQCLKGAYVKGLRGPPSYLLDYQITKKARTLSCNGWGIKYLNVSSVDQMSPPWDQNHRMFPPSICCTFPIISLQKPYAIYPLVSNLADSLWTSRT